MKHVIHTPTEQFGYVETEYDIKEMDYDKAIEVHKCIVETAKPQTGMSSADFNAILDDYLTNNKIVGDPGMFEKMSVEQVAIIQAIKRSRARTK